MRSRLPVNLAADVWRHLRARDQRPRPEIKARLRITNDADGATGVTRIDLMDEIGYWGISAQDFIDQLAQVGPGTIELHVNSPGGDVFDGVAIMNALSDHPATVNVIVDGIAASAASYIATLGGDTVKMNRGSQLMIHDALGMCVGNAADMEKMKALLDRISDSIAGLYAERAGGEVDAWRDLMRAETWYSGAEAVAAGLADVDGAKGDDPAADPEPDPADPDEADPAADPDPEADPADPAADPEEDAAAKARAAHLLASYKYGSRAQAPPPEDPKQTAAVAVDVAKLQAALEGAFS